MTVKNDFSILNLVESFLTSIKFNFDSLSRKIKNPCLVINKNSGDTRMKKLIIIFGLLLATSVAFGKSAYKQWGKKATVEEWKTNDNTSAYALPYLYAYKKGKKDGDMVLAVYVLTNDINQGSAHVMVTMSTSEPIDNEVGKNSVFIGSIQTNREKVGGSSSSSMVAPSLGSAVVDLFSSIPKTVTTVVTNKQRSLSFVSNGYEAGRYVYLAVFTNINPEALAYYQLYVEPSFKNPYMYCYNLYSIASQYREIVRNEESRKEALVEAEKRAKEKAEADGINTVKRLLNDKRFKVEYEAGVDAMVVRVQNNDVNVDGTTLKMGLQLNRTNYKPNYIQFRVYSADVNSFGLMQNATIYTADGEMRLECIMQNYFAPTYNDYQTLGYKTFTLSWCNSKDFYHLNDMLKSGKPIKISFSGSANVTHTLTASERKALSDLLDVVFTRWQIDRKTATADWGD